jgi:hypothetical protein
MNKQQLLALVNTSIPHYESEDGREFTVFQDGPTFNWYEWDAKGPGWRPIDASDVPDDVRNSHYQG